MPPRRRPRKTATTRVAPIVISSDSSSSNGCEVVSDFEEDDRAPLPASAPSSRSPKRRPRPRFAVKIPSAPSSPTARVQRPAPLSTPAQPSTPPADTWPDAHAPDLSSGLVMSAITVNKLRKWLTAALDMSAPSPRVLILTGPPGAGKSTAVKILASEASVEVAEWQAPLPVGDLRSTTAFLLESLESFAVGMRYPSLISARPERRLLLIDDLPLALTGRNDVHGADRLVEFFKRTSASDALPTVVILSDNGRERLRVARALGLDTASSPNMAILNVPPATEARMIKVLEGVARRANRAILPDSLNALVAASAGDIRAALNSLHLYAIYPEGEKPVAVAEEAPATMAGKRKRGAKGAKKPAAALAALDHVRGVGSDATLDTLHAVGKVLNNKRLSTGESRYDAEQILADSRADPSAFVSFLHHNYPSYFNSVSDACDALELVSESEALLEWRPDATLRGHLGDCAASVVTRGFLWHNQDPIRTGWRPVLGPQHYSTRQEAGANLEAASKALGRARIGLLDSPRSLAIDFSPYAKRMAELGSIGGRGGSKVQFSVGSGVVKSEPGSGDSVELAMMAEEEANGLAVLDFENRASGSGSSAFGQAASVQPELQEEEEVELPDDTIEAWDD